MQVDMFRGSLGLSFQKLEITPPASRAQAPDRPTTIHQTTISYNHQSKPHSTYTPHQPNHHHSTHITPQNVFPLWRRSSPALFRREDRSSRGGDRDGLQHVQPVRHVKPPQKNRNPKLTVLLSPRLVDTCTKKCIPPQYREADLNKGESVCLDRCVSKFFEVNVKVSEKMQGEAAAKQGGGMIGA
jgi:import inner membrane translocase subunit TIM10